MILTDWIQEFGKIGTILLYTGLGIIGVMLLIFIIVLTIGIIKDR